MKLPALAMVFMILLFSGCSSVVQKTPFATDKSLLTKALSGELILGRAYKNDELPNVDLFGLTPEMRQFAETVTTSAKRKEAKAEALHQALMTSRTHGGRGITYTAYITNTGIDAFEQRQANCLSYTLLFVSMARHLGLNAEVNEVMLPPTWDMRDSDTYLFMRHVNAKVFMPRKHMFSWVRVTETADVGDIVVDLEMRRFRPHYKQKVIGADLVAAQFYSNRGMELSAEGDARAAFLYLRKALLMSAEPSYIWSNFGSFYRRQKMFAEAEAIYLHGLAINPRDYTIMHNLAGLYLELGNTAKHKEYQQRVRQHRNANPYYMFKLAEEFAQRNEDDKALDLLRKSIKKEKDEVRFYKLAAEIYERTGDSENAKLMRDKIYQLDTIRF
ncbi:transglutaminase-like domain-containing protein [Cellvibrio mixtus]|uniref:transglutaminase-like domain-containing protein n=1 Tax=Cellvibrio mixtus TaxID=39650 RepID=UPI0005872B60|nr:transglutaminase-like domain-containing protein [Cellvibrio mixtus]